MPSPGSERIKKPARKLRRFLRALSTVSNWMGWPGYKYGFHIPYRWAGATPKVSSYDSYHWLKNRWDGDRAEFESSLAMIENHLDRLAEFAEQKPDKPHRPRFNQSWCPGLDGASAYAFVREYSPANIIEVGSGHSTRFMAQAIEDGNLSTHFMSIDPQPRRAIDHLCTEVIRTTVDQVPLSEFERLQENDILFFDGSHIGMPGTDVDTMLNQVFPTLKPGVLVHIHDIFLPHGYPDVWDWRGYNEQNMVASLLAGGERFTPVFASSYIRRHMSPALKSWPITVPDKAFETSLWLRVS